LTIAGTQQQALFYPIENMSRAVQTITVINPQEGGMSFLPLKRGLCYPIMG